MVSGIKTRRGVVFTLITPSITSFLPFLAAAPIYSLLSRTGPLKMNAFSKGKDPLNQLKNGVVTVGRRGTATMAIVPGLVMTVKTGGATLATAVTMEPFVFGPSHVKGPKDLRRVAKNAVFDLSRQYCHHKKTEPEERGQVVEPRPSKGINNLDPHRPQLSRGGTQLRGHVLKGHPD